MTHLSNFKKKYFFRLFSNFALISAFFVKIPKKTDITANLAQNKKKNHKKIGYTLPVLSKNSHFWRFWAISSCFLPCFFQLCGDICVFRFPIFSAFSWILDDFLEQKLVNKTIENSLIAWIINKSKASDNLKHVRDSIDRDWTFFGEGTILRMVAIMITKIRFLGHFFALFLNKNWAKNWTKNWTILGVFFDSFLKTGHPNYSMFAWRANQTSNLSRPD